MYKLLIKTICVLTIFISLPVTAQDNKHALPLRGINLVGAGFASSALPGRENFDYIFPSASDIKIYADFGMEVIRLSFLWERLQPELDKPLNAQYLNGIESVVREANNHGLFVILDVHNYGAYQSKLIGSDEVTQDSFNNLWFRLATHFKDDKNVMFGIMNEPNRHSAAEWFSISQGALLAIRGAGAKQKILVPSTFWSSAYRFFKKDGTYSNAELLGTIKDPENNFIFEVHIYFDSDSSGTHDTCPDGEDIGVERIKDITQWLKTNKFQAILGEFGASQNSTCLKNLDKTLAYMDANNDAWYGWAYWAAGPWLGDYMFSVYPPDTNKYPQAKILKKYIDKTQ